SAVPHEVLRPRNERTPRAGGRGRVTTADEREGVQDRQPREPARNGDRRELGRPETRLARAPLHRQPDGAEAQPCRDPEKALDLSRAVLAEVGEAELEPPRRFRP